MQGITADWIEQKKGLGNGKIREITQSEGQKENKGKTVESLRDLQNTSKWDNICIMGIQE